MSLFHRNDIRAWPDVRKTMKNVLTVVCFTVLTLFVYSCSEDKSVVRERLTKGDKSYIENIRYTQDSRTGLCFAVGNGGAGSSAPFTTVPCEAIPPKLLNVIE